MNPVLVRNGTFAVLLGNGNPTANGVKPHAGMLRYPAVSKTHIVFEYANDLFEIERAA